MKLYADSDFYFNEYLQGRSEVVPVNDFPYWSTLATSEIKNRTFGRVDALGEVPENVQMCCCEVAEKLYVGENVKSDNGMVLQSYSNDGESATFKADDVSADAIQRSVEDIIRRWLSYTGLLYCGV